MRYKPRIRSLTLHAIVESWDEPERLVRVLEQATRTVLEARRAVESSGFEVWTARVALPPMPRRADASVLVEALSRARLDDNVLYSVYHREAANASIEEVRSVLSVSENIYASISAPEPTAQAARLVYEAARLGADMASRVAITVPDHVETPYFPAASTLSSTPGLSAALLYPGLLRGRDWDEAFIDLLDTLSKMEDVLADTADRLGLEFYGFDLSLSPWMDDSVAAVLEELLGDQLGSVGTMAAIAAAEDFIAEACEETLCTGFNQVMLPVAEDNRLKQLVASGRVALRDLVAYSYACVAGVDLPVVPLNKWSENLAYRILSEMAAASYRKDAPLGIRIIALNVEPGQWVDLPRFGKTPATRI